MGRDRRPLRMFAQTEGTFAVRFWHPLLEKTIRINLGDATKAHSNLAKLNRIFMTPSFWRNPPSDCGTEIIAAWLGTRKQIQVRNGKPYRDGNSVSLSPIAAAATSIEVETLRNALHDAKENIRALQKELMLLKGKRFAGPSATIGAAAETWKNNYHGRDPDHKKSVEYEIDRFVKEHDKDTLIDDFAGKEREIEGWISQRTNPKTGKTLTHGRRRQIRNILLRFLEDSGLMVNRRAVKTPGRDDDSIDWLTKEQAQELAKHLPEYWQDVFRVQCNLGLRPDELPTLRKANFDDNFKLLTLAPFEHLTLKLGPRTIRVPESESIRAILRTRCEKNELLFPQPTTGAAWKNIRWFDESYRTQLKAAKAKMQEHQLPKDFQLDCRTGRRTCASLLLRNGVTAEAVAELLGDDPRTVRKHYARLLSHEIDTTPATI